jgi:CelD/BcsL family acetyltransferase involved in cellulose biosynthesis
MSKTTIRVVAESKELESLAGVWDSLLQRSGDDNSIYLTYEWVSTWWKHFGEGKKLNILLIKKEEQVIGIVPLMRSEYRIGLLKWHLLETIGAVNCNYVGLILFENRQEALTAFLAYLEKELVKSRLALRLSLVPQDSQFLHLLRRHASLFSQNLVAEERVMTLAPYISLPATWEEYFHSLGRRRRKSLRSSLQELEEAHSVRFQECDADSLEDWLSRFFDLHQKRWQSVGVRSGFSNPKKREFYRDLSSKFLQKKWLHFSCLKVDDEMVSAEYGYIYNGKLYAATSARDLRYSKYSIGHLHHMYLTRDAIARNLREVDLLRGDEPYKFYWTKSARKYMEVIIIKKGLWTRLRLRFLRAFLRLCEVRQYSLREIYHLYLRRRREEKERKRMGLAKMLE